MPVPTHRSCYSGTLCVTVRRRVRDSNWLVRYRVSAARVGTEPKTKPPDLGGFEINFLSSIRQVSCTASTSPIRALAEPFPELALASVLALAQVLVLPSWVQLLEPMAACLLTLP